MFNYYVLERIAKDKEDKDLYRNDTRYIQKRNLLADRYRERVMNFIEKMAVKPVRQKDDVYNSLLDINMNKSKMLGKYTILGKLTNDKERLQQSLENSKFIVEPGKELRE
mmetsp:Transcript_6497/g.7458  ORF Transcript_6497/g.7458 Transcript_6497/m.7458 type:complete len:110 (-) Transcript_6497:851-1180(-)